ncbi:helix-turn-helix domain-containing protein [Virgisporangium aliadipatigenens]|uniref:helix-turn-helix domain-containing protein n=1 Tax=Virgisporangium aliadipatigenens TaxID=741659 RepID=UPI001EF25CD5|nr:winged helix-turn-helix domain-containing protein [Virgisporangium aliadipatigenens]
MDESRLARLAEALDEGPAVHGFGDDQRWTFARMSDLIARSSTSGTRCAGTANIMYRLGWSVQVPKHRAVERDEQAV